MRCVGSGAAVHGTDLANATFVRGALNSAFVRLVALCGVGTGPLSAGNPAPHAVAHVALAGEVIQTHVLF